jgi:hypothetical protein
MPTLLERFREKTARWVTAPSGIEYHVCGLTMAQGSDALDAMFEILKPMPNGNGDMSATDISKPQAEEIKRRLMILGRVGVLAIRFEGEEQRPAPPPEQFPAGDLPFVGQEINRAAEPPPEVMDDARRVLPE